LGLIGPGFYADAYDDNSLRAFFTLTTPALSADQGEIQFPVLVMEEEDKGRQVFKEWRDVEWVLVLKWRLDGLALGRSGPKYRPCYSFCTGFAHVSP